MSVKLVSKPLRAVIYSRYSTDKQRVESIEDQIFQCEKVAAREGFVIVAKYHDRGISGGTADRPGYQEMLKAARAHQFDILIAEDISRLWRNNAEFGPRSAELEDLKIHMVTCVGDDTRKDGGWGLLIQIKLAVAADERKKASYRTRRGLEGKARKGEDAGGRAYGYTPGAQHPSGKRTIDPEQAKIVRSIFEWRAEGWSAQRIAQQLNLSGVPSPGASWKRKSSGPTRKATGGWRPSAIAGDHRTGNGILNNPLYKGVQIWSRTKWTRQAQNSAVRVVSDVDQGEWITVDVPHLAIVTKELWEKVRVIQTARNARRDAVRKGVAKRTGCESAYWLGSLLVCGDCGSNFIGSGKFDYICPSHTAGSCTNGMRFRRDAAHQAMYDTFHSHVLSDGPRAAVKKQIEVALQKLDREEQQSLKAAASGDDVRQLDDELAALKKMKLRPAALAAGIEAIEAERAALIKRAAGTTDPALGRARKLLGKVPEILDEYERLAKKALKPVAILGDVHKARALMRTFLVDGQIRLSPTASQDGVTGIVPLKGLGDHLLELAGLQRKSAAFSAESRIGSGGRI